MPTSSCTRQASFAGFGSNACSPGGVLETVTKTSTRRDEVDLLVVDAILVRDGDRDEEDPQDVVALSLDSRARLVVVHVGCEQGPERRRVHALGQLVLQLGL